MNINRKLEKLAKWYEVKIVNLNTLTDTEVDTIEKIVKGEISQEDLPKQLQYGSSGFIFDHNRIIAAEVLQALDYVRAFDPIVKWLKDLAEADRRHWTTCMNALDSFEVYTLEGSKIEQKQLEQVIPCLEILGLSSSGMGMKKQYPLYATKLIGYIGGDDAEQALEHIKENGYLTASEYAKKVLGMMEK